MTIELLNMDCMEYMKEQPDSAFDLAIVDPPYGISVSFSMGWRKKQKKSNYRKFAGEDKEPPSIEYFKELRRVSKNQIIWGANHFIDNFGFDANSSCWLLWDKKFSENVSFSQYEMAWTSFNSVAKKFEKVSKEKGRIHPTQKPADLYAWILSGYASKEMRILDTHLGSGSSAIAAHYFGCDFVGCEIDPGYYRAAKERFDRETAQLAMFGQA